VRALSHSESEVLFSDQFENLLLLLLAHFLFFLANGIEVNRQVQLLKPLNIIVSDSNSHQVLGRIEGYCCDVLNIRREFQELHEPCVQTFYSKVATHWVHKFQTLKQVLFLLSFLYLHLASCIKAIQVSRVLSSACFRRLLEFEEGIFN